VSFTHADDHNNNMTQDLLGNDGCACQ